MRKNRTTETAKSRSDTTGKSFMVKIVFVVAVLQIGVLLYVCASALHSIYVDHKQRAATNIIRVEKQPLNSIVYNGKRYVPNQNVMTFLFMGIDISKNVDVSELQQFAYGQADAIFLAVLDTEKNSMKIIGIPRDTMVDIKFSAWDGSPQVSNHDQICLQYAYGENPRNCSELMIDTITEQVFPGITIDYSAALHISVLSTIVDDIGGLNITMTDDCEITDPSDGVSILHFNKGETYPFDGKAAVNFAQDRDCTVSGSAMDRLDRQKDFLRALYHDAKTAIKNDPTLIPKIYEDVKDGLITDLSLSDIISLANNVMDADFSVDSSVVTLPGVIGEEVSDFDPEIRFNTYELDKDGTMQIMMDTWYLPLESHVK